MNTATSTSTTRTTTNTSTTRTATNISLSNKSSRSLPPAAEAAPPDWPRRLRLPVLRESQLTDIVVEALTARLPDCRVEATGELEATITTRRSSLLTAQL